MDLWPFLKPAKVSPALATCKITFFANSILTISFLGRSGFVPSIKEETKALQADIDRMQTQLELFDRSSVPTSAYSQKHAIGMDSLGSQLATARMLDSLPSQNMSKPSPFLFVGVLSVADNSGRSSINEHFSEMCWRSISCYLAPALGSYACQRAQPNSSAVCS